MAPDKVVPPTTRLEFLGITFDAEKMTMEISDAKMKDIKAEIKHMDVQNSSNQEGG